MAEKDLWATLRDHTKIHGHFERIENSVGIGRPDVNYCIQGTEGNIELKQIQNWPSGAESIVRVKHFSPQQRNWIRARTNAYGRVYVLLEVVKPSPVYVLMAGKWAREHLSIDATRLDILRNAMVVGLLRFPTREIVSILTGRDGR